MNHWRKDIATWRSGNTLHLSVVFTWHLTKAAQLADDFRRDHKTARILAGGPAVKLQGAPWADETPDTTPFDVLAMHNPCATFTTRGCPNRCPFCAVPKIEGPLRELPTWKPAPTVCDNNLLAASRTHFEKVIDSLRPFPACDFNQGLDARLLKYWHVDGLLSLHRPTVRFALDHTQDTPTTQKAVHRLTARGFPKRHLGIYVLIGFDDTPQDAHHRLETVRSWGIRPNPMRFQPLDATKRNDYVAPGWTEAELRRMTHYYSRLQFLEHIPYEDFRWPRPPEPLFDANNQKIRK